MGTTGLAEQQCTDQSSVEDKSNVTEETVGTVGGAEVSMEKQEKPVEVEKTELSSVKAAVVVEKPALSEKTPTLSEKTPSEGNVEKVEPAEEVKVESVEGKAAEEKSTVIPKISPSKAGMKSNPSDSELMPPPATPITTPSTPTTTPVSTPIEDKENSLTTPPPMKGSKSMVADPSKLQRTSGRYTELSFIWY